MFLAKLLRNNKHIFFEYVFAADFITGLRFRGQIFFNWYLFSTKATEYKIKRCLILVCLKTICHANKNG